MEKMQFQANTALRSYALALLFFAAAFALRLLIDYVVPDRLPFITFFPAVLAAAYYCGLGPSILLLLLSAITGTIWSDPTGASPIGFYIASFLLFVALAGVNVALVHYLITTLTELRARDQQLAMINRELKHRIKNLFAIANSICLQTIRPGRSTDEMSRAVTGRIMAIASAQDLLTGTGSDGADLRELVAFLVTPLAPDPSRLKVDGPETQLPGDATTPFALILHELATNALKYGAWSTEFGLVKLDWTNQSGTLDFRWREHDGPVIAPPMRDGLGRTLIKSSLPGATVTYDLKADGLECEISLPLTPSPPAA